MRLHPCARSFSLLLSDLAVQVQVLRTRARQERKRKKKKKKKGGCGGFPPTLKLFSDRSTTIRQKRMQRSPAFTTEPRVGKGRSREGLIPTKVELHGPINPPWSAAPQGPPRPPGGGGNGSPLPLSGGRETSNGAALVMVVGGGLGGDVACWGRRHQPIETVSV